ncbi:MAG TPA: FAD-binding oxidoreductase [Nocardioidaceae bacterium]|nr:FAD-binding oxidoreductase [Nocardioidaceae bacterium]
MTGTPAALRPRTDEQHQAAVERLLASYRAVPASATVRLAKRTSNLFRPRDANEAAGLDVSGLDGVLRVDPGARTADVQGMCTYERLVEATLPHGLMPCVVPQLRTITLGGAVTGLGIESTSLRNGLPHESVQEMDVLTGDGRLLTVRPGEHDDLLRGFPNSYGTLGYATRLRIELQPVRPYVALHHVRFDDPESLVDAVAGIAADHTWAGEPVDFVDGVMFSTDELYLTLGRWADHAERASDYTGRQVFYRSIPERGHDVLTVHDYLWRWDTDWFWCSRAFGAQHPAVRPLWPRRWRRSDVYHRLVRLENRYQVAARIDRLRGRPARERVIQDVEVPVEQTAAFLRWFAEHVGMTPVWLCPLQLRGTGGPLGTLTPGERPWPLYPLQAGQVYVNVGFWGMVPIRGGDRDGDVNRRIEHALLGLGGHKSLYSDAYYDEEAFWDAYGGDRYRTLKQRYDADHRLLDLYAKAVGRR